MPKADEREKILRLILQKHCRESLHSEDAVDCALLEVPILHRCTLRMIRKQLLVMLCKQPEAAGPPLYQNEAVEEGGRPVGALTLLAERTEGYSGSDLHDLCALAAQQPIHRFMEQEDWCAHPGPRAHMCTLRVQLSIVARFCLRAHTHAPIPLLAWCGLAWLLCAGTLMVRHRLPAVRCRRPWA